MIIKNAKFRKHNFTFGKQKILDATLMKYNQALQLSVAVVYTAYQKSVYTLYSIQEHKMHEDHQSPICSTIPSTEESLISWLVYECSKKSVDQLHTQNTQVSPLNTKQCNVSVLLHNYMAISKRIDALVIMRGSAMFLLVKVSFHFLFYFLLHQV